MSELGLQVPILTFRTGEGLFFRGPAVHSQDLVAQLSYQTIIGDGGVAANHGVKDTDGSLRTEFVPAQPNDHFLIYTNPRNSQQRHLYRLQLSTVDFADAVLEVSSPQTIDQSGKYNQVPRDALWRLLIPDQTSFAGSGGVAPFEARGGSGFYSFIGAGQRTLGGGFDEWEQNGDELQLTGTLGTEIDIENRVHVAVQDREYGNAASTELVFLSTRDLTSSVSDSTVPPRDAGFQGVASKVFDVTEGGSFSGVVTAAGVDDTIARVCEIVEPPNNCGDGPPRTGTTTAASGTGTGTTRAPIPGELAGSQGQLLCGDELTGNTVGADLTGGENPLAHEHHYM